MSLEEDVYRDHEAHDFRQTQDSFFPHTEPPHHKLRNLERYLPGISSQTKIFAKLVCDYIEERVEQPLTPDQFTVMYLDTIDFLRHNDIPTSIADPQYREIAGLSPVYYGSLKGLIRRIAPVIFPGEFASEVIKKYELYK